jgi:thiol-disulfide isomerase/thioredoxin
MTAEYGIPADLVLLQSGPEVFEAFGQRQMPSVVIIDADGEVRQEPAYGAHAVRQRVADSLGLAMPEAPMRQRADPVAVGDKAPVFHRPDLDGIPYQVGGPTAGDTLLLFWNPGCPHCETLMPELKAWEADPEMPKIVVISRGPVALNQEMALASPVVLDDDRAIATAHGATGTPAAVVIDRLGMISSGVGRGASGVRALVHDLIAIGANGEPAVRVPDRE